MNQSTSDFAKTPWQATTNIAFYKPTAIPPETHTVIMWYRDKDTKELCWHEAEPSDNDVWGWVLDDGENWAAINTEECELLCWCHVPVPPWLQAEWNT